MACPSRLSRERPGDKDNEISHNVTNEPGGGGGDRCGWVIGAGEKRTG